MSFLNLPLKAIQADLSSIMGVASMAWYNPSSFPVPPGQPMPPPIYKDFKWRITLNIDKQSQSSILSRSPGAYTGIDVVVGQWIANVTTGQAWQIITVESKTDATVGCIIQDIYRYNTYRDVSGSGAGGPGLGAYVIFSIGDTGVPEIDPVPPSGVSSTFGINIQSRFQYINLQFDYPLYQAGNDFIEGDVVSVDSSVHAFAKSDANRRIVVGRVTSVSDTMPGWFTINPAQKIDDYIDYLPGGVGDIIYTDVNDPGALTAEPGGSQIYIKLRDHTESSSINLITDSTTAVGNVFQLNGHNVVVGGTGTLGDIETSANLVKNQTGVEATLMISPTVVKTNPGYVSVTYGEPALWASSAPAIATINGVQVIFNIPSTDAGYEDYARPAQMIQSINLANIPNIVASIVSSGIQLTNVVGGPINIGNITSDTNAVPFGGTQSGAGISLSTSASSTYQIKFTAIDARAINFLNVIGNTVDDVGLVSVENGVKACGLYIEEGLRTATSTVVTNLTQLNALRPLIGDSAYVIDSVDSNSNNAGEWSMWLYDGAAWVVTSTQDSASTDAKSLEYTLTSVSPANIDIGKISTGRRVSLITVEVMTPFSSQTSSLSIGYKVINPTNPAGVVNGLMTANLIDLSSVGTYTTASDVLFGTDTAQGDIIITGTYISDGSTTGTLQIIVSYI